MSGRHDVVARTAESIGHLAVLCAESALVQDTPELKHWLAEIAESLRRVRVRLEAVSEGVSVAFVGLTNVGKSTLMNALFGVELAPRRNGPCTPIAIEYRYGESFAVRVLPSGDTDPRTLDGPKDVMGFLAEKLPAIRWFAPDLPPRVRISAPLAILKTGVTVIDTPGFGAAQTDEGQSHDTALRAFLRRSRSSVVWVVNGQQGITAAEKRFHEQHLEDLCDHVVVTSCEDWDARDRERFVKRFGEAMGRRTLTFHFASGLDGMRARSRGDQALLDRSGVPDLERHLLDASDRDALADRASSLVHHFLRSLREAVEEFRPPRPVWREDSLFRWREVCACEALRSAVEQCLDDGRAS